MEPAWVKTCGSNFRLTSRGCSFHPQELQHTTPLTHREGTGEGLPGETPGEMRKDSMEAIRKMEPAWQKIAASNFRLGTYKYPNF